MFNKVILIGRLGQTAEAKTTQNSKDYVVLDIATQESWKNDKGDYETRTEWHRVYAWSNLSKFARTLQKGQLITLEGTLQYREVIEDVEGQPLKHRIAEIHATSMKRLWKVEAAADPADGPPTSKSPAGWMSSVSHPPSSLALIHETVAAVSEARCELDNFGSWSRPYC